MDGLIRIRAFLRTQILPRAKRQRTKEGRCISSLIRRGLSITTRWTPIERNGIEGDRHMQRAVNLFLNSKGGVGKSHHAVLLVQAYRTAGEPVIAIDADATSATFASFKGLGVRRIQLM